MTGRTTSITGNLNQTAVYWGSPVSDGIGGRSFADPVEISVRWQDTTRLFIDPATGQETVSSSVVYAATAMVVGGFIVESTLAALSSAEEGDPQTVAGVREVRRADRTGALDNTLTLYKVWL